MKARVKATGEIIEVSQGIYSPYQYVGDNGAIYTEEEIEILQEVLDSTIDYWTRFEHQAAIAAMGGMCGNTEYNDYAFVDIAELAIKAAHALVEKYKKEKVMELLQKIKDIYEDADKNWNHGYGILKYLDENNDLQESRTDYSTVISYAMDAVRMLDDIKSIIDKEERE